MKCCDLHTHSNCSDGTLPPEQLVSLAEAQGIAALALTDHNTAKGLPAFMEAGKHSSVETVAGCEFTTMHEKTELHIVGLFFKEDTWTEVEDFVTLMHMAKKASNMKLIQALQDHGYEITYDEVAASTEADEFNRAHVAQILVNKHYIESVRAGFQGILAEDNGFYEPPKRLSSLQTVRFIKTFGAVAVLAHPLLNMDEAQLNAFLPLAKEAGLDAIETRYSLFDATQTQCLEALAARYGLKQSGGSDFHGATKPNIRLGTGTGTLAVPYTFYEELKP